jgi:hypothetical protein
VTFNHGVEGSSPSALTNEINVSCLLVLQTWVRALGVSRGPSIRPLKGAQT